MTAVVLDLLCICIIIISSSGHRTGEEWFYTKNTYHSLQTVHNERPCFLLEYSLNFCIQVVVVVLFFFLTSYATFTYADFLSPASLVEVVKQGTMSALLDWEWEFHKKVGMSRYWKAHFLQENCSLKLSPEISCQSYLTMHPYLLQFSDQQNMGSLFHGQNFSPNFSTLSFTFEEDTLPHVSWIMKRVVVNFCWLNLSCWKGAWRKKACI